MKKSIFAVSAGTLIFSLFALARGADAPTWRYLPINSESAEESRSGLIFSFDNPTEATATVEVSLQVDGGQRLDLKAEVQTDRIRNEAAGYVHFPMKNMDTLKVLQVTIVMGEYSGVYDAPAAGQNYQLVRSRKKGVRP